MKDFPIKGKDKFWLNKSYFIGENESQKNRQFKKTTVRPTQIKVHYRDLPRMLEFIGKQMRQRAGTL